jgi:hypothetical protein
MNEYWLVYVLTYRTESLRKGWVRLQSYPVRCLYSRTENVRIG